VYRSDLRVEEYMGNLSWKIGDVTVTRIVESDITIPICDLLPGATPEAIAPHKEWLQPHFIDDNDQICISFHSLVVKSGGKIIVVDTCIGEHGDPFAPDRPIVADFLDDLTAAGFPREKVDVVLCTHLHYDHVGWNTMQVEGKWVPTFPNARYLFSNKEYEHWERESQEPVVSNFSNAVQWAEPDWSLPMVDDNEVLGAQTRCRIATEHTNTGTLIIGTHYPTPTAGLLVDVSGKVQFKTD
jgi:hypothetical protein